MISSLVMATEKQVKANDTVNITSSEMMKMSEEIKDRTGQQKTAMDEIVSIISTISDLIQSSAAGAEQMAETGQQMSLMADKLKVKVGFFKV
jgi:methyl-accepting chemotaxis protein